METKKSYNANAVASFISSLFFWMPLFNFLICALSIYLGIRALRQIKEEKTKGTWFAVFGIILGSLPYYFGLLYLLRQFGHLEPVPFLLAAITISIATIIIFAVILFRFFHGKK
ncbi:MAG: DUF4190 domain-containing protein [Candidatus Woesearchaeota archaeon]